MKRYRGEDGYRNIQKSTNDGWKIAILLGILVCCLFLFVVSTFPQIQLSKQDQKITYGEKYRETDYNASTMFKNLTKKVKISSDVDVKKVGKYHVKYQVKYLFWNKTVTRSIEVIDNEKPEISLQSEEALTICPNVDIHQYEFGYKATDNYDGDITDQVKVEEDDGKVIFRVSDSSGNETIVTRKLIREDKEKPKIQLKGKTDVLLKIGQEYKEEGFTVTDNCDGNLNDKVKQKSNVNNKQSGVYQIQYLVTDSSSNQITATRNVVVSPKKSSSKKGDGVIYLTFDDGPSKSITPQLLDILKEENVKATFFIINHSSSLDYLIKREHQEGHTVALHSYTHNYKKIYQSQKAYFEDLEKIGQKVKRLTGVDSKIIRFPGGSSNTVSRHYQKGIMSQLVTEVEKRGYRYFDWNVGSGDAGETNTKKGVYQNVTANLSHHKTNIVLMHDFENNYKTLNAVRDIIKYGKVNGYRFAAITTKTPQVKHGVNN